MIPRQTSTRHIELCLISPFQLEESELSTVLLGTINGRHSDATDLTTMHQGDSPFNF